MSGDRHIGLGLAIVQKIVRDLVGRFTWTGPVKKARSSALCFLTQGLAGKNRLVPLRDVKPFWSILPSFDARAFHAAHGPFLNSRMFEAAQLAQVGANLFHCIGNVIDILATADEKVVRHPDRFLIGGVF